MIPVPIRQQEKRPDTMVVRTVRNTETDGVPMLLITCVIPQQENGRFNGCSDSQKVRLDGVQIADDTCA